VGSLKRNRSLDQKWSGLFALETCLALADLLTAANDAEALQLRIEQLVALEADLRAKLQAARREMNEKQAALVDATAAIKAAAQQLA
jgi:hypothetical protein